MMSDSISDDQALEALLSSAHSNQEAKEKKMNKEGNRYRSNNTNGNDSNNRRDYRGGGGGGGHDRDRRRDERDNYRDGRRDRYGSNNNSNSNNNDDDTHNRQSKRQRRINRKHEEKEDVKFSWGDQGKQQEQQDNENDDEESSKPKEKANFGLSGALAEDEKTGNTYNGIVLKFSEPPEARTPNTRWRLYVFKKKGGGKDSGTKGKNDDAADDGGGELLQTLHISRQSAYLFGRERKVADVPVDHPSLSKQHCVIQYRALPDKNDRELRVRCKPYLIDLGSTNGTFLNGVRIDDARYYELRKGDVITLGASSREYVLLTENTTSNDL